MGMSHPVAWWSSLIGNILLRRLHLSWSAILAQVGGKALPEPGLDKDAAAAAVEHLQAATLQVDDTEFLCMLQDLALPNVWIQSRWLLQR
jgi:hypothetical protein